MSSTFAANVQTATNANAIAKDSADPHCGALSLGSITSQTAMAGTNGVETLLVTGNRDQQINGNESVRVTGNRKHTITGNQDKKIVGSKTEKIISNSTKTIVGNALHTVVGTTGDSYTGEHTVEHKADQFVSEIAKHYHEIKEKLEKHNIHVDDFLDYQLHAVAVQNFIGWNVDFKALQNAVIGVLAEKHFVCAAEKDVEERLGELEQKTKALKSEIGAIEPVVYVTKVHEVAITQKILVIGINQFM